MNEINDVMIVSNERCEIHGKTPVIGETSTGCCLNNTAKSTIIVVMIHTLISLLLILTYPSHCVLQRYLYMVVLGFPGAARVLVL